MSDTSKFLAESVPTAVALALAASKIIEAHGDPAVELEALETAAEALKLRLDQLKFPNG